MAALTVANCKDYLKIEHTAEDTPLIAWLASSSAAVQAELGVPIYLEEREFVLEQPIGACSVRKLFVPLYPIAPASSSVAELEIVDGSGNTLVEDTHYRVNLRTGVVTAISGSFASFPYTITCSVGLEALDEFDTSVEPVVNAAILDTLADRYQRRSPAATTEATGGSVSQSYSGGLPHRVIDLLAPFRVFPLAVP
jgi:hypothetical protein